MSARVHRLDPTTANRIAAGEVIERPASVLKELLDNALDAQSTRIDIVLRNGGRQLIQVTDNGCGMRAEDAVLALQRFTTSKIDQIDDLETLTTLGFRGEALPSIAAVAELELITRPAEHPEGICLSSRPEAPPQTQPSGCAVGTRVRVHHLFARIPVRLHALKSVSRELHAMQELVAHYALAHPQVMFHLKHDDRSVLFAPVSTDFRQRLAGLFGHALIAHFVPLQGHSLDVAVHGAVSTPHEHRSTRQRQYFWVNGRPIRSPLLSAAVERAYGALLPPGRHPLVALGLTVSPALLDVNVHPRKAEVRFLQERAIFASVQDAVALALQHAPDSNPPLPAEPTGWEEESQVDAWQVHETPPAYPPTPAVLAGTTLRPLGQIGGTFLVAGGPQGLLILDQHAAHESFLYAQLQVAEPVGVELPEPLVLPLTPALQRSWTVIETVLTALGLPPEPFGAQTVLIRSVPEVLLERTRPSTVLEALQEALQRATPHASPDTWREHLAAALACRAAIRAGDTLAEAEVSTLLQALTQRHLAYTCPHGRPTHVTLSLAELEHRFLRLTETRPG